MTEGSDGGTEAVEAVLEAYYKALGVPPPAPGVQRLAMIAVEAARRGLRREWEEETRSEEGS